MDEFNNQFQKYMTYNNQKNLCFVKNSNSKNELNTKTFSFLKTLNRKKKIGVDENY